MKKAIGLMAVALAAGLALGEADKVELVIKDGTYFPLFSVGAEDGIGLNGRDPGADNLIKHTAAVASEMKIVAGRWHHVCGTWDGVNIVLYVDGKVVATDTSARGRRHPSGASARTTRTRIRTACPSADWSLASR